MSINRQLFELTMQWGLMHHQHTSPLAALAVKDVERANALLEGSLRGFEELLLIDVSEDMIAVCPFICSSHRMTSHTDEQTLNPAPRISMLHALSHTSAFTEPVSSRAAALPASAYTTIARKRTKQVIDAVDLSGTTPKSAKRRRTGAAASSLASPDVSASASAAASASAVSQIPEPTGIMAQRGDLLELQTMFNLYRAAGRNINLWDWLEGFRAGMLPRRAKTRDASGGAGAVAGAQGEAEKSVPVERVQEEDEDTAARLHAAFVRFCEEARMMGLMRAKGNARRRGVDEVVKSIGLF
jgi:hypothetical protein